MFLLSHFNIKNKADKEYKLNDLAPKKLKVLFMGLDNAGKTSIILTLLRQLSKIIVIEPTKAVQTRVYEFLGVEISEWDLGGHASYRESYLKSPEIYFDKTDILIYVIDIQDNGRSAESLNFLIEIIIRFKAIGIDPLVFIFFHKFDPIPVLKNHEMINTRSDSLKKKILTLINYPESKIGFFKTSIFNLPSIINTMSIVISNRIPKTILVHEIIKEFSIKMDFEGLVLIDDNSLIICSYYKEKEIRTLIDCTIPHFLEVNDTFKRFKKEETKESYEEGIIVQRSGKFFLFKEFKLKPEGPTYYFLNCMKNLKFNKEDFETFVDQIREVLKN